MSAPRAPRRERTATESLLSIVLGLEAVLVFFAALVAFGTRAAPAGLVFGGAALLVVLLALAGRFVRYPWGVWFGWALQVVLIVTGLLVSLMYLLGAGFLALYAYCFVRGRQLDKQKAAYFAAQSKENNS